jgi:hypothetical protein
MASRGTNEAEVVAAIQYGEAFPAKFGRTWSPHNFTFNSQWRGQSFASKQIEVFAVIENNARLVITVFVRYF